MRSPLARAMPDIISNSNIRAHPLHPCRSVFYSAIHTPLRRTIGPATTIQRLQRNTKQHTKRRFSVLSSRFSVPGSRFSVLSSRFSVLGSQFSVLSSRFSVLGSQFSVLGSRFSVLGSQFSVLSSRFSVPGSQFSVLGSRFLVLGSRFSVPGSQFSVPGSRFSVLGSHSSLLPQRQRRRRSPHAPCRVQPRQQRSNDGHGNRLRKQRAVQLEEQRPSE
jgi:hypothetical protein